MVAITFIAILVSITRVQLRETASAEVNQQSQFIMQTLQRYIEEASLIETLADQPTSILTLRLQPTSDDDKSFAITKIYFEPSTPTSDGAIFLIPREGSPPEPLNSSRVVIDDLTFIKKSHPPAHDSVDITLALHFKTSNPQKRFEQFLQTSVARVSAATFDSDLNPTTSSVFSIGNQERWQSINDTLYWSGDNIYFSLTGVGNLGVNIATPAYTLDINGSLRVAAGSNPSLFSGTGLYSIQAPFEVKQGNGGSLRLVGGGILTCSAGNEGLLRFIDGSPDRLEVCMDNGSGLQWSAVTVTP